MGGVKAYPIVSIDNHECIVSGYKSIEFNKLTVVKKNSIIHLTKIYRYANLSVNNVRDIFNCYLMFAVTKHDVVLF